MLSKPAGIDADPRTFRIAVEKALYKEGLMVGQWQVMPVPAQDIFQSMIGYGKRYPWAINETGGFRYEYNTDDYPVAENLCETYTNIHGFTPPNGRDLQKKIVAGFHKVFDNLDKALAHADDDISPGFDGSIYGVG